MKKLIKIYWKLRKILNPEFIAIRNNYIQKNINECKRIKEDIGEDAFNTRWGQNYIENMEKDLV